MTHQIVLQDGERWLRFAEPLRILTAATPGEVIEVLTAVETAVDEDQLYAAGFLSYEAAAAFGLPVCRSSNLPLAWFGLYQAPDEIDPPLAGGGTGADGYSLGAWTPSVEWPDYERAIGRIKAHIARGDSYQVNYTLRLRAPFSGDPWSFFQALWPAQRPSYAAFIDTGPFAVCSASPELFFALDGDRLMARPMKGTAARGRTLAEDEDQRRWLQQSEKNRAENVMIVDMIRNDLGRVARFGSVQVPVLFAVERYPTLWQMTSTIVAHSESSLVEMMAALFPCASITGAPKVRTMQIINALEPEPRGIYTGAMGFVAPAGEERPRRARCNVAIRTVVVDKAREQAEYGVGGGIVWDSDAADEYKECQLKARVLAAPPADFDLLEALLWTPEAGYFLLERHLRRLADSADYFGIPLALETIEQQLATAALTLQAPSKVRLVVGQDGRGWVTAVPLGDAGPLRVGLAASPVDSSDIFLYHKTSRRAVYDDARASRPDCDDVLLWNERGELTEAGSANVVVELDGQLYTPPVNCGLLPGTFRADLLARTVIVERVIPVAELAGASRLFLINSVRKWRRATLVREA